MVEPTMMTNPEFMRCEMNTDVFPIPTHLKDILIATGKKNDEFHVEGIVKCPCGCENFYIMIYADTEEGKIIVR